MPRKASVQKSNAKLFSKCESSLKECDGEGKWDKKHPGGEEMMRGAEGTERMPASQPVVTLRYFEWSQIKPTPESSQQNHLEPSPGMTKSLESEGASGRNSFIKSEKRNCSFPEPDPSSAGQVLEEFGDLGEAGESPSPSASSARGAATWGWERGTGGPEGSQSQRPHGVASRGPSKLDVPISSKLLDAQVPVAGPVSQPVKDIVLPSSSFPNPSQTSPPVPAAGQNLAAWVEEILNTYLDTVEDTGDTLYKIPGSVGSALTTCGQVLGGDCASTRVLLSHPAGKTRTALDIIITLAGEGGLAAGLVSADTGDGERRGGAGEVQMAESGSSNPDQPAEPVESPSAEECRRYVADFEEPPLAGFNQLQAPGRDQPSQPPPPAHGHISPRLSPRDPGFSRFLQQPLAVRASSKPERQKPASLPEPLQQAGGLIVSCNKVEGDTKIMSTNRPASYQTDQHLSSPHAENSTVHQNGDGVSESTRQTSSSLQPSKEDLKNKVYEVFIKDKIIVNGSDPAETKENSHQKVVPLSYSPTLSDNVGNQSKVDSLICIGTIGCDRTQESIEDPQCDEADVLQKAISTGHTQQMNTLCPQSPDQNGLFAEALTPPKYELSASGPLNMDSIPQSVESSLFNPQQALQQNALNLPTDSVNMHDTEMPAYSSQSVFLQKPMEIAKDINLESSSVVNPESQAQTLKLDESTGEGNSGQELHPSGIELIDYQLSLNDVFFQNKMKKRLTNAIDDPDSQSEIDGFVDTIRNLDVPILLNRNRNPRIQRSHSLTSPVSTLPPIEEDQTDSKFFPSSSITEGPLQPAEPVAIDEILQSDSPIQPVLEIPKVDCTKRLAKKENLTPGQMMMQFKEKPRIGVPRISAENSIVFQSSLSGRINVDGTANPPDTEALNGDSLRSRFRNSVLFSTYRTPIESFSSRSLDVSLGSVSKSQVSAPPATTQNSVQRSWSQEDSPTTTIALDKLSTPSFLANSLNGSMDAGTDSLPFSISERLLPGYSRLSDSGRDLRTQKMSQPSEKSPAKLTAFPDSWKSKPKDHEHINPRPGKIVIYDKQNFTGVRREISCDVADCSTWPFPAVISIKIIRGCWVLYEEPDYKGKKIFLAEEDIELTDPWADQMEEVMVEKETEDQESEPPPTKPIVIGSLRRAVRDYSTPQISLYSEDDGEGKKLTFYGESEDIRIFGYPPKITSIIVNAGLWLVYSEPFFEGKQHALELGGYRTLQEWGADKAQVGSLVPLRMGGPRVENPYETKLIIFERAYFGGKSREVHGDSTDFLSRYPNNGAPLSNAGSIKVYGGIWVGYSKEGFRGHQYLMEEGEYLDWRSWGGYDEDLKSLRVIRTDFSNPMIILYPGSNCDGEDSIEAIASVPDLDQDDSGEIIQSINVLSGAWVAYEGANYSGAQYIVEKGLYRNLQEWGAQNCKIASLHPILLVESNDQHFSLKIQIFSENHFTGRSLVIEEKKMGIPKEFKLQSCRVLSGSWALYEGQDYDGRVFVVSEGEYPDLPSMGCRMTTHIRCVKTIPHVFSQSLITLHGLENFEGKEIELDSEVKDLVSDGYNNMVLSLHVIGGVWVIYEYSNFRGRQVLLEPIEISNWPKYSSFTRIGSIMPIAQKRVFFNVKNKETGDLLSVLPSEDDVKSGRIIVAPANKELEQLWFFDKGLLKPKFAPDVSLQTIGTLADSGSKVVLWTETRSPRHCWTFEFSGTVRSLLYEGFVLDIKGGKSYDRDAAMICKYEEQNPVQQWEIQML